LVQIRTLATERYEFRVDQMPMTFQARIGRHASTHHSLVAHFSRHLVLGVQFLHRKRLLHMHVTPANCVICREVRLCGVVVASPSVSSASIDGANS